MIVLGVDPGLAHGGVCAARLHAAGETIIALAITETEKSDRKRGTLASDDDTARCRLLHQQISRFLARLEARPKAICVEAASWPRNAGASAKTGMARGILASFAEQLGVPIVQVSPQEAKKVLCGKRDASKLEVDRKSVV